MAKGFFGNMFDEDGDGKLNIAEQATELAFGLGFMQESLGEDEYPEAVEKKTPWTDNIPDNISALA